MFAKLFDTQYGQVVVMLGEDETGMEEIRTYVQPDGFGVCSIAEVFHKYDNRNSEAKEAFNSVDFEYAVWRAAQLVNLLSSDN